MMIPILMIAAIAAVLSNNNRVQLIPIAIAVEIPLLVIIITIMWAVLEVTLRVKE